MIINMQQYDKLSSELQSVALQSKVIVDGKEIGEVWYVDTDLGLVKTYDVLGDGKPHNSFEFLKNRYVNLPLGLTIKEIRTWDLPMMGPASKTVRGEVELIPIEEIGQ